MNWNQNWQKQNAIKQLQREGKKLSDYPWPEDGPKDDVWHRGTPEYRVEYDKNGQIVISESQPWDAVK